MTLGIVKRDGNEFADWLKKHRSKAADYLESIGVDPQQALTIELGWLISLAKFKHMPMEFDHFQSRFLLATKTRMRSVLKCRQVGFSFEIACESLARCHLNDKHLSVFVSYNLDDAKEKIALVREIHEMLPLEFQKRLLSDNKHEVSFKSNKRNNIISRVVSYPSKAPRGKTGDVYLDELAHCQNDAAIYAGATALISRSKGQLTIGSTPLGRRGTFWEVHTQELEPYTGFWRQEIPWWLCKNFCNNIHRAVREAPGMDTAERVAEFGTYDLQNQFGALPLDDFQQEFELAFQDEKVSFFPYDLIKPCADTERGDIPVYRSLGHLGANITKLGPLYAGFDVGRTRHPSELTVFELKNGSYVLRYEAHFRDMSFPEQRRRLMEAIAVMGPNLQKFRIDATGLGSNMADDLKEEHGRKVEAMKFTAALKEDLMNNLKILFQETAILLPRDRELIGQIHSIKQRITTSGTSVFDAEKSKRSHSDRAWSIALAVYRPGRKKKRIGIGSLGVRVLGERAEERVEKEKKVQSIVERAFSVPADQKAESENKPNPVQGIVGMQDMLKMARLYLTSARVYQDNGDPVKALELMREYKRLRRRINRRAASGDTSVVTPQGSSQNASIEA